MSGLFLIGPLKKLLIGSPLSGIFLNDQFKTRIF